MSRRFVAPGRHALEQAWRAAWPAALEIWSRFVQLHEPAWCFTAQDEQREHLSGSFAMIRLVDHSVVVSLRQVEELGLAPFAVEILAHEIGHHVYCPANLTDNARMLARIRRGLPTKEVYAPLIANLYGDLLINDRLQRVSALDIAGVYVQLGSDARERLWTVYMRMYELLWGLPRGSLAQGDCDERLNQDAGLGARLVRSYAKEWLEGAGRFAALCLPYVLEDDQDRLQKRLVTWCDLRDAGRGGLPDGMAEIDDAELAGAIHPAEDPELSGVDLEDRSPSGEGTARVPGQRSGHKSMKTLRQPFEYAEVLKAAGADLDHRALTARYYRELAVPHLIPFPTRPSPRATDPMPEGWDIWDVDAPLDQIDWFGSLLASPVIVPGVTTRERTFGDSPGHESGNDPIDLYLGIDCSGSMGDPAYHLSYPVLAGAIIALSALRAGSRVKVVLSGEPGRTIASDGFGRDASAVLRTLTSYLGTGYAFGIHRLAETFGSEKKGSRAVHILIISDNDMFRMLDEEGSGRIGWEVAREALQRGRGGGTFVLQIHPGLRTGTMSRTTDQYLARIRDDGWDLGLVSSMDELVAFARAFSRQSFGKARHRER